MIPSHFVVGSVTLSVTLSDWPPLENTGNSGSHKMLRTPGFGANLDTKKPATIEEAGEVLHTEKVEPAGVRTKDAVS
jgi:hypothetical protein